MDRFNDCLSIVLKYEGGFVDDPHDRGGATNAGITLAAYRSYKPGATIKDLREISTAEIQDIYKKCYWNAIGADNLSPGVDLAAFDYAVNSGIPMAQETLKATSNLNDLSRIKAICSRRYSFLRALKNWRYFGKGWGVRIAGIEASAARMALQVHPSSDAGIQLLLDSRRSFKKASGAGLGTILGGATVFNHANFWLFLLTCIVVVFLVWRAFIEFSRARAFQQEASHV